MDEGYQVGILLDGAGLAQVAQHGAVVVFALYAGARELRQGKHGYLELLGQGLQAARDSRDLLGAVLVALASAGR